MSAKPYAPWAVVVLVVLFIAPYLVLGLFNQPQNDDFVSAAHTQLRGYLGANKFWYETWVGRYSSTALTCLLSPDVDIVLASKVSAILVPVSLFAAAVFFCRQFFAAAKDASASLVIGAAITALYLLDMPDLVQGIYWMSGALTYQLGNILFLVICALIARHYNADGGENRPVLFFWVTVATVVAVGTNELTMLLVFLLFSLSGAYFLFRRTVQPLLLYGTALSGLCSLVVVFSPGTRSRLAYSQHNDLLFSLLLALKQCALVSVSWLFTTPVLPAALLLVGFIPRDAFLFRLIDSRRRLVTFAGMSLLVLAALFFPSYYGTGIMEPRTLNVIFLCFTLVVFVVTFSLVHLSDSQVLAKRLSSRPVKVCLLLGSLMTLLPTSSNNLLNVYTQIVDGSAYSYDAQLKSRFEALKGSDSAICVVTPLKHRPGSLFFFENAVDPVNDDEAMVRYKYSYARFFGKSLVVLAN